MRLVDADRIPFFKTEKEFVEGKTTVIEMAYKDDVDELPTVDAVPVEKIIEEAYKKHNQCDAEEEFYAAAVVIDVTCKILGMKCYDELFDKFDDMFGERKEQ